MIDFAEYMRRSLKELIPALKRNRFRYLSIDGHSFLQKISNNLTMALERNKASLLISSDNSKENNDKKWVSILNSKENWARFKKNKTSTEVKDINLLNQFWDSQNQFVLFSNESLVESLNVIIFCLNCVQAAIKEYEKNGKNKKNLDKKFIKIHSLNESLKTVKSQLTNAMLVRLKIAHSYSNRKNYQIPDVDDVVYYISHSLNSRGALNSEEQRILPAKPRKSLFTKNKNYYLTFYDCIKKYGDSKEEKKQIDAFHWSRIINKPIFPLTNSIPDYDFIGSNKVYYYGFSFSEIGKIHKTKIAIPSFLYKFVPEKYQSPAWFYWQDNTILNFWEKRQEFLANLQCLWVHESNSINEEFQSNEDKKSRKEQCIALIDAEILKIAKDDPSFFAFKYKEMLDEWGSALINLRAELTQSIRNSEVPTNKPVTHNNMSYENKKDDGVKKPQSRKNAQLNILEVFKESEDEYQDFMSDDSSTKVKNPQLSVNTDWKVLKKTTYISAAEASRFCINGLPKDYASSKERKQKPLLPPEKKVSYQLLGRVY